MTKNTVYHMEDCIVSGIPCVYVTDEDDDQHILFNVTTLDVDDPEKFMQEYPDQTLTGNDYARGIFLRGDKL